MATWRARGAHQCYTVVRHRHFPAVREMPVFEGLLRCPMTMAEREGFEPPIGLHLCRISSAVHSTTLPPLLKAPKRGVRPPVVGACSRRGWRARQAHDGQNRWAQPKGRREGKLGPPYASTDWRSHAADAGPRRFGFRRPAPAARGKLAMARMAATRSRFKPYRSRLPPSRGRSAGRRDGTPAAYGMTPAPCWLTKGCVHRRGKMAPNPSFSAGFCPALP